MKYLILGAKGQVGLEFEAYMKLAEQSYSAYDIDTLDICDYEAVAKVIKRGKPEVIINCAAFTQVDKSEMEPGLANTINAEAVKNIAKCAKKTGSLLVHYSTDFVFDGETNTPYNENSIPNPINRYGKSKFQGEKYIQEFADNYIIIRTSRVYGKGKQNFPYKLKQWAKKQSVLHIKNDDFAAATSTGYLINKSLLAINSNTRGIIHVSEKKPMSLYRWALEIAQEEKIKIPIKPTISEELKDLAVRPKYSVLGSKHLEYNNINLIWQPEA